jgi:RNA polymerase sigma factor (sigma-70 family)
VSALNASDDLRAEFLASRPEIERFLRSRVSCPQIAADLASEIYLRLYRVKPVLTGRNDARAYLFRMAANIAIDHNRLERRRSDILNESEDLFQGVEPGPEPAALARSEMAIVESALAELPEKCREILILSRLHGLTHGEIAKRMNVSKSLVEKYIARALVHCRQRLNEIDLN